MLGGSEEFCGVLLSRTSSSAILTNKPSVNARTGGVISASSSAGIACGLSSRLMLPGVAQIARGAKSSFSPTQSPGCERSQHLVTCLVYDLPNTMRFVNQENLAKWDVTLYEAMEVARQNLDEQNPASYAMIDDRLFIFQAGDAYDATRMLSLDMIRSLKLNGKPVALPITRDCLMITGSDDAKGHAMMVALAEKQLEDARPLCFIPHVLDADEWTPWSPGQDHPQHEKFRLLEVRHFGNEYAEQKAAPRQAE